MFCISGFFYITCIQNDFLCKLWRMFDFCNLSLSLSLSACFSVSPFVCVCLFLSVSLFPLSLSSLSVCRSLFSSLSVPSFLFSVSLCSLILIYTVHKSFFTVSSTDRKMFNHLYIVVCKCFKYGPVQNAVIS